MVDFPIHLTPRWHDSRSAGGEDDDQGWWDSSCGRVYLFGARDRGEYSRPPPYLGGTESGGGSDHPDPSPGEGSLGDAQPHMHHQRQEGLTVQGVWWSEDRPAGPGPAPMDMGCPFDANQQGRARPTRELGVDPHCHRLPAWERGPRRLHCQIRPTTISATGCRAQTRAPRCRMRLGVFQFCRGDSM